MKIHEIFFKGLLSLNRGLATQTLVKKDAVKGWTPPRDLAAFEDYHLTQHILHRGYKFIRTNDVFSRHFPMPSERSSSLNWGLWNSAGVRVSGAAGLGTLTIYSCGRIICAAARGDVKAITTKIGFLIGYIEYRRFLVYIRLPNYGQKDNNGRHQCTMRRLL